MTENLERNYTHGRQLEPGFETSLSFWKVGVIMGSRSDWPCMIHCTDRLEALGVPFEYGVVSAHRTPVRMKAYATHAEYRRLHMIIACAGGSAHLPGMVASETTLPVLGVAPAKGDDAAMWSMVRMPPGVPLAFVGCGKAGAQNAALQAARMLALHDPDLMVRVKEFVLKQAADVPFSCHD